MKTKSTSRSGLFIPCLAVRIAIPLLLLSTGLMLVQPLPGQSGTWTLTGSLANARYLYTATLLPNGKVLAAGGFGINVVLASAELYDPEIGTWTATGSLANARYLHTATLLPNGRVLVSGGQGNGDLASAELYDPETGTWTATGSLASPREGHTATLLPNGQVLVAGGGNSTSDALATAEVYDPATGLWTATGSMHTGRRELTATLLPNGKVLVAAGYNYPPGTIASAELYDPGTGTWTETGSLADAREGHTATLLPSNKVLVAGGYGVSGVLASAELYDPETGTWAATGSLANARYVHTATLLPDNKVLAAGGLDSALDPFASGELYDPETGAWAATGSLANGRFEDTATLLPSGKVLAAGGLGQERGTNRASERSDSDGPAPSADSSFKRLASAELYESESTLTLLTAASRKLHGSAGAFDIDLPLTGEPGVECRSSQGKHTFVFTFNGPVVSGTAAVTSGTGNVQGAPLFSGNSMTVKLTGVTDVQKITVTLSGVTSSTSEVLPDKAVSANMLIGDTDGNKTVNKPDGSLVKQQLGMPVTVSNFREDVKVDGAITNADFNVVKLNAGHSLP